MARFDRKSRYAKLETYPVKDRRGRKVAALPVPDAPDEASIGEHVRKEGQRLDHLANAYVADPNGYWRIAELNNATLPEQLSEAETIEIPTVTK